MPHITVQASENVPIKYPIRLLQALNHSLWTSGHFKQPEDIKARILEVPTVFVGIEQGQEQGQSHGFVYIQLKLMPGRSDAIKNTLATTLLECAQNELTAQLSSRVSVQFCIEVEELSASYQKQVVRVQ